MEFIILLFLGIFIILYRLNPGDNVYKFFISTASSAYEKYAPYSFKSVRAKVKELGQDYSTRQYITQIIMFAGFAGVVSYLYFYNILLCIFYAALAVSVIPYLTYLRCQRIYSEFIFEQIETYTSNVIMEFNTTQSFVKALEGVRDSGIIEEPVLGDLKRMIDMSYQNGTIDESIDYFNKKYPYYMVKNMHQLFYQITKEGARDAGQSLENMSMDIDSLVEGVYRDQMDRKQFHTKFITFGLALFFLILAVQLMYGPEKYMELLDIWYVQIILHTIIVINALFLLKGEKYYNEDVGVE